jgi:hypothetical protein
MGRSSGKSWSLMGQELVAHRGNTTWWARKQAEEGRSRVGVRGNKATSTGKGPLARDR